MKEAHRKILNNYATSDSVKVAMGNGKKSWWPVTKISYFLKYVKNPSEITDGLLPKTDQRKIAERKSNNGWKNTIVTIQPEESTYIVASRL